MNFEDSSLKVPGFRAGRLGGIEIWIHWLLVALLALNLLSSFLAKPRPPFPFPDWLVGSGALILAVLLHELGHAGMAFRVGGRAERVILWPLGGFAICDTPQDPRSELLVAWAGPAVNLILAVLTGTVCLAAGWSVLPTYADGESFPYLESCVQHIFLWNSFLLAVNLLPCLPLDGGCMLRAFLWARLESRVQATMLSLRIGQAFAVVALVTGLLIIAYGFFNNSFRLGHPFLSQLGWGFLLAAWIHFLTAKSMQRQILEGDEDEGGIFGYDFSRGYTSLERPRARRERPAGLFQTFRARLKDRARAGRQANETEMRERLDELLAKIHEHGMESLTGEEKRFLKRASKLLRR